MQVIIATKADAKRISDANPEAVVIALLSQTLYRNGLSVRLSGDYFRYITILLARRGTPILRDELIDELWGDDEDGGPDTAYARIQNVYPKRVRKQVACLGVRINCGYGMGYSAELLPLTPHLRRAA